MTNRTHLMRIASLMALLSLTFSAYGASMKKPDIKLNTHPRMRYEITATVNGAPGPFELSGGSVDYKVVNLATVPMTPITGATVEPQKQLPVVFERVAEGVYRGVVYLDQVQDEDYFGLGVCHWSIVGVSIDLHHDQVNFSPAIYMDDIVRGIDLARYFSFKSYQNSDYKRTDIGAPSKSAFNDPTHTFTITLKAEERTK